jgi:uncharacterized protein YndB with AHSA1/START domain
MQKSLSVRKPSDREVEITRVFDAPKELVFDAFTKPDLIKRWLLGPPGWTMPVCRVDPKVGGKFRYGWRNANDGREMGMNGVFRELTPPDRIVHTEIFDEDWTGGETVVTTLFKEKSGKTTVAMTVLYGSEKARDAALGTGMTRGVEDSYARLDEMLAVTV